MTDGTAPPVLLEEELGGAVSVMSCRRYWSDISEIG
jgi:hypothetical protein